MFSLSERKLVSYVLFCILKGTVCLYTREESTRGKEGITSPSSSSQNYIQQSGQLNALAFFTAGGNTPTIH